MTYAIPMFNLGAVVDRTGVSAHTLRAWERRYGLPRPARSEGGHRLYSQRDIEIIGWLAERQEEGMSISRAVDLWEQLDAAGQDPLARAPAPQPPPVAEGATVEGYEQAWVEACLHLDEARAERISVEAFAVLDPETVVTGVLQRGLSRIGDLWYEGRASVHQEHFATELAVRRVEALISASPPPTRRELIIAACPPGELHSFGLLLATLLLRRRGWNVLHLGANVPLARLSELVADRRPDLVLSAAQQLTTAATLQDMANLLYGEGVTTAYGGWVFNRIPQLRNRIPGHFLGEGLDSVPQKLEDLMGVPPPLTLEPPRAERVEAVAHFGEQRPRIDADLRRFLEGLDMSGGHLGIAMTQLPNYLAAALQLCDLGYMDPCMDWIVGLLANLELPHDLLPRYVEAYHRAARLHLDERGEPILAWLWAWLEKVAESDGDTIPRQRKRRNGGI
jgi:methanogenic corrinoid protein MtbC1